MLEKKFTLPQRSIAIITPFLFKPGHEVGTLIPQCLIPDMTTHHTGQALNLLQ